MIGLRAQRFVFNIVTRDEGAYGKLDSDFYPFGNLPLDLQDRLVQHLAIELEPDTGHLTMLLGAKQISGTPDLKIPKGDLETRAQPGKLTYGF